MRTPITRLLIAASLTLSACASGSSDERAAEPVIQEASRGLDARQLQAGECGVFLWNRTNAKTFVFFKKAGDSTASYFDTEERRAENISNDGELFGQFFTRSEWQLDNGERISVSIQPGEEIEGGRRIPDGVISSTTRDGWETKIPVAGVIACQES